jgi:hypothetical protein
VHGLAEPTALQVAAQGSPDMSVSVSDGTALITGSSVVGQGVYGFVNDAAVTLPIATAHPTNPRKDLVVAQIRDSEADGLGFSDAYLSVVTGTAAASPVDPAVPDNCLVLARVNVAALATSITGGNITNLATAINSLASLSSEVTDVAAEAAANTSALSTAKTGVQIASTGPGGVQRLTATRLGPFVFCEGYTSGQATAGTAIPNANFPVGMRPVTSTATLFARCNNSGSVSTAIVEIGTTGNIAASVAAASWVYLTGVFRVA